MRVIQCLINIKSENLSDFNFKTGKDKKNIKITDCGRVSIGDIIVVERLDGEIQKIFIYDNKSLTHVYGNTEESLERISITSRIFSLSKSTNNYIQEMLNELSIAELEFEYSELTKIIKQIKALCIIGESKKIQSCILNSDCSAVIKTKLIHFVKKRKLLPNLNSKINITLDFLNLAVIY
jgi:hypothetical protein